MEKIIIAIVLINLVASLIARKRQQDAKKRAAQQAHSGGPSGPDVMAVRHDPGRRKEKAQREHVGRDAALREEGTRREYTGRDARGSREGEDAEKPDMPTPMKKGMAVGRDFLEEMAREMGLNIPTEDKPSDLKERQPNESSFVLDSPEQPLGGEPALDFDESAHDEWQEPDSGDDDEITTKEKKPDTPYHIPQPAKLADTLSDRSFASQFRGRTALRRAFVGKFILDPPVGLKGPDTSPWD